MKDVKNCLLLIVGFLLVLTNAPAYANLKSTYECITGVREVYRGNLAKPISSENFTICQKLAPQKHKSNHKK